MGAEKASIKLYSIILCRTVEQNRSASITLMRNDHTIYIYLFNTKVVMMIITIMIVIKMGMMTKLIAMIAMVVMMILIMITNMKWFIIPYLNSITITNS